MTLAVFFLRARLLFSRSNPSSNLLAPKVSRNEFYLYFLERVVSKSEKYVAKLVAQLTEGAGKMALEKERQAEEARAAQVSCL